jgi:hypothetical protein
MMNMATKNRTRPGAKTTQNNEVKNDVFVDVGGAVGRWVKAKPATRGTACGLGGLYLAGGIFGPLVDPVWVAALAVPVGAIAGINGQKTGGKQWGRVMGAAWAAVPSWLALSSVTGIGSWPVAAGYATVAAGLWAGIATSDVVTAKKRYQLAQEQWAQLSERVGLSGSVWRDQIPSRLGYDLVIDIRSCLETASKIVKGDVAERLAAELALPRHRVRIMPAAKHAGMVTIEVIERDPWATSTDHPIFDASSEICLPATRSITDPAGLVIGIDPLTGLPLSVPVWDAEGACNVLIAAAMGAGKTTLVNCLIEQITSCVDALVWMIDVTKAKDARLWDPAVDWTAAGPDQVPAAMAMLKAGVDLINTRAAHSVTSIHQPTPDAPAVVIIVDEASGLFGRDDDVAEQANKLIDFIATKGRSEGVAVIVVGQRGTASHLGKAGLKAAMKTRVLMRVTQRSEMQWIVPGHDEMGLPDMLTYGDGKPGVALVVNTATQQGQPGRVFALHELDKVRHIAAARAGRPARLEPPVAAKLGRAYAQRHAGRTPATPDSGGGGGRSAPGAAGPQDGPAPQSQTPAGRVDTQQPAAAVPAQWEPLAHDPDLAAQFESVILSAYERTAAASQAIDQLAAQVSEAEDSGAFVPAGTPVPPAIRTAILGLLAERGAAGAGRADLAQAAGIGKTAANKWLGVLVREGTITGQGKSTNRTYVHSQHGPKK